MGTTIPQATLSSVTITRLTSQSETVSCPSGKSVIGGGGSVTPNDAAVLLSESYPVTGSPAGWKVTFYNGDFSTNSKTVNITVYAICSA